MFPYLPFNDDIAVIHQDGALTFREFHSLLTRLIGEFHSYDLHAGDRIAVQLPNSLELLALYYMALACGYVMVPVNERQTHREASEIVQHAEARMVVTTPELKSNWTTLDEAPRVVALSPRSLHRWLSQDSVTTACRCHFEHEAAHPAILYYTSGSTGKPKGVLYSNATLWGNTLVYGQGLAISQHDHSVLCHCMASNFVFAQLTVPVLSAGGRVEIVDFGDAQATLRAIDRGATFLSLIPWFGFRLIEEGRKRGRVPNRLRNCEIGGDRVPGSFFRQFASVFGIQPREHLGMTETNTSAVNWDGRNCGQGCVGRALTQVQIEIRDDSCRPVPTGDSGQIWVRSPANMVGYWRDDAATRDTCVDGWMATGDLGHLDEDGFLWFEGRMKQIIVCDGDNIYPREVECELAAHPEIGQACVVGLPDPRRGEIVAAAIVLRDPTIELTIEQITEFLRPRLTEVKIPKYVVAMPALPETSIGKLDHAAIVAQLLRIRGQA